MTKACRNSNCTRRALLGTGTQSNYTLQLIQLTQNVCSRRMRLADLEPLLTLERQVTARPNGLRTVPKLSAVVCCPRTGWPFVRSSRSAPALYAGAQVVDLHLKLTFYFFSTCSSLARQGKGQTSCITLFFGEFECNDAIHHLSA